tara:strand:- start:1064 stop:1543 length:480 start_codon:yes stop_codon:yes gene_type:complete
MIHDQIEAYRRAVADTARARTMCNLNPNAQHQADFLSCQEEEQLRLDGLKSVIRMVLQDYATQQPFNPFSINGDVNQPSIPLQDAVAAAIKEGQEWFDDANANISSADCIDNMMTILDDATSPCPPTIADTTTSRLEHAVRSDPQVRTVPNGPPPREDL